MASYIEKGNHEDDGEYIKKIEEFKKNSTTVANLIDNCIKIAEKNHQNIERSNRIEPPQENTKMIEYSQENTKKIE